MNFVTHLALHFGDFDDVDVVFYYSPPEYGFPESAEICAVTASTGADLLADMSENEIDALAESAIEHLNQQAQDSADARADHAYDISREDRAFNRD